MAARNMPRMKKQTQPLSNLKKGRVVVLIRLVDCSGIIFITEPRILKLLLNHIRFIVFLA